MNEDFLLLLLCKLYSEMYSETKILKYSNMMVRQKGINQKEVGENVKVLNFVDEKT